MPCSEELTGQGVGAKMERALDARGYGLVVTGHSLGAGTAALISLKLKERFPGKSACTAAPASHEADTDLLEAEGEGPGQASLLSCACAV